jgi:hypothetical protein
MSKPTHRLTTHTAHRLSSHSTDTLSAYEFVWGTTRHFIDGKPADEAAVDALMERWTRGEVDVKPYSEVIPLEKWRERFGREE